MIDMLKRHEIQVLQRAGHSQIEIAALAGVSRRSVQRVERESVVTHIDAAREREARGIGPARSGGLPVLSTFDRPKTVASKWNTDAQVTEWSALFAGVALDLGLGIEVCWPSSPRQKGSIENLVGWVKGSFFKQRPFLD